MLIFISPSQIVLGLLEWLKDEAYNKSMVQVTGARSRRYRCYAMEVFFLLWHDQWRALEPRTHRGCDELPLKPHRALQLRPVSMCAVS
jgi:hypothetical protein